MHEVCRRYCDFLIQAADREPYSVLLAILFGVEASYLAELRRELVADCEAINATSFFSGAP